MKYDFTTLPDRHGRDSIAVDGLGKGFAPDAPQPGFDAIPIGFVYPVELRFYRLREKS